ncbi:MAG: hypothetical protein EOM54_05455 [Clostridia bacterium]|nr:hypothetical protein [Clostridia bacterium]NCC69369.1 hypothetical protein [Clostridia bacterium]
MDIEKMGRELAQSGKIDKLRAMADSDEAKRLSAMLDAEAVKTAARTGDAETLRGILNKVLGTDEGRRLAQQLSDAMK